jgi:predicted NACHT family NTPase
MPLMLSEPFETAGVPLSEVVELRRRFLRSVNLEQDFYTHNPLDGYQLTGSGVATLERIAEGIEHTYARAFSITGTYGSGKSAFALFAAKVRAAGAPPIW